MCNDFISFDIVLVAGALCCQMQFVLRGLGWLWSCISGSPENVFFLTDGDSDHISVRVFFLVRMEILMVFMPMVSMGISRPTPKPPDLRVHLVSLTTEPPLFQLGVVSRVSATTDREYLPFTVTNQSDSRVFVESNPVLGSACLLGMATKAEVCAAASVSDGLAQPPKVRDMFDWTECAAMSQQQARSVSCCACTRCHFSAMRPLASVPYPMVLVPSPMAPSPHHLPMLMMMPHPFVAPSRVPQRWRGPPAKPAPHLPSWKKRRHLERKREARRMRCVRDRELMAIGHEALLKAEEERLRSAWRGRPKECAVSGASAVQSSPASTCTETSIE